MGEGIPPCPSPTKGTPLVSPCLKAGVLRGTGDNKEVRFCWTGYSLFRLKRGSSDCRSKPNVLLADIIYRGRSPCTEQEGRDRHMNDGEQHAGLPSSGSINCYGEILH